MWTHPFRPNKRTVQEGKTQAVTFLEAQGYANFVVLHPTVLPKGCTVSEITVRAESERIRPSVRFVVSGRQGQLRVKQFFYDWSYPGLADSNLIEQGTGFVAQEIVGYLGWDYKGNRAACHTRMFTQIELSVLEGEFADDELIALIDGLVPVLPAAVEQIGWQPFALTSHSARFHTGRWGDDELTRATWSVPGEFSEQVADDYLLPPAEFKQFVAESIGYTRHDEADEYQMILRAQNNKTDVIWVWITPKHLGGKIPMNLGARQHWDVQPITIPHEEEVEIEGYLGVQETPYGGWRVHWQLGRLTYHVFVRSSLHVRTEEVVQFVQAFASPRARK